MRRRSQKTLRDRVEALIARRGDDVFLTREFARLGGEDQVIRALRELVRDGRLIRLGYGVYACAERSRLSGRPILTARDGFVGASRDALTKLGVDWETTGPPKQSGHTTKAGRLKCQPMRSSASKAASRADSAMVTTPSSSSDERDL